MNDKIAEIRGKGSEASNVSFEVVTAGDEPETEARFDYRLPPDQFGAEVEFDPDSVANRVEE